VSTTGQTLEIVIQDRVTGFPVSGATCLLYDYGAVVTGNTVSGVQSSGLTSGTWVTGKTDASGVAQLTDVAPGMYAVVVVGTSYRYQIPAAYQQVEVSQIIRGRPDFIQLHDATGGTHYAYVTTGGALAVTGATF